MLDKRPHILSYVSNIVEPYQDTNGDWVTPQGNPVSISLPCRAEVPQAANQGREIASEDGTNVKYSWVVFVDKDSERIPYGTIVNISNDGYQFATGTVKLFSKEQKKCRIWI